MKRYSETISDELKDKVLRIQAQHVSDFKSCAFEIMEGMSEDFTVCLWRRAQKDEETNSWLVKEYQTAPYHIQDNETRATDLSRVPAQQRILMHRACFLDALHACASFETYERSKGKLPLGPDKEELGLKHYQFAGEEEEGIPFSLNSGLPIPAANGIILSENSDLPALSEEFEQKSKGNLIAKADIPPLSAQELLGREIDAPQTALAAQNQNSKAVRNLMSSTQQLEVTHKKKMVNLDKLSNAFNRGNESQFKRSTFLLKNPIATLSQSPSLITFPLALLMPNPLTTALAVVSGSSNLIYGVGAIFEKAMGDNYIPMPYRIWRDNGPKFPMREFHKRLDKVRKDIEALDDEADKNRLLQAADKMELAGYTLRARYSFNKAADKGGWLNNRRMDRDIDRLETKARSFGMPQNDIDALLLTLQEKPNMRRSYRHENFEQLVESQCNKDFRFITNEFENDKDRQQERLNLLQKSRSPRGIDL